MLLAESPATESTEARRGRGASASPGELTKRFSRAKAAKAAKGWWERLYAATFHEPCFKLFRLSALLPSPFASIARKICVF